MMYSELKKTKDSSEYQWLYFLPNLLTTVTMCAGFYSMIVAIQGDFNTAAIMICAAAFSDGWDGRVARLTNTQSAFGAEYDSLSDLIAFGAAPTLMAYNWSFSYLGTRSWLIAFLYLSATAMRLARFNTISTDKRFQGLPCPMAAVLMASTNTLCYRYNINGVAVSVPIACMTVILGCLMVSTIPYYSAKLMSSKMAIVVTLLIFSSMIMAFLWDRPEALFCIFLMYALSGPVTVLCRLIYSHGYMRFLERNHL